MPRRTVALEVISPVKGLDYRLAPSFVDEKTITASKNTRCKVGEMRKAPGYTYFGTPATNPLTGGIITAIDEYHQRSGSSQLLVGTEDLIYIYTSATMDWNRTISRGAELSDCESVWTASANVTAATDAVSFKVGTKSAKLTIAAAFATGLAGYIDFAAVDCTNMTHISFWVKSDIATSAGDLRVLVDNTSACASPLQEVQIPALTAGVWKECLVAIGSGAAAEIISVGLKVQTDLGAQVVNIDQIDAVQVYTGTIDTPWMGDVYFDDWYYTNNIDYPQRKIGSARFIDWVDAVNGQYKAKIFRAFSNHGVLFNTTETGTAYPQRVRWTDVGLTALSGGTSGAADIDGEDHIVTAEKLADSMAIYKENSIVLMTHDDADIFHFDRKVIGIGLLAPKAIVNFDRFHIFMGTDNIYAYDGGVQPTPIGDQIRDELFSKIASDTVNRSFMVYDRDNTEILLYVPTGGSDYPNEIYRYHVKFQAWTKGLRSNVTAGGVFQTGSSLTFGAASGTFGSQTLTFGSRFFASSAPVILLGDSSGFVNKVNEATYDDNGAATESYFDTIDFTAHAQKDPIPAESGSTKDTIRYTDNIKRWLRFCFDGKGGQVSVYYSVDEGQTYILLETVTMTLGTFSRYFVSLDVPSDKIRFRFYNATAGSGYAIRYYAPFVQVESNV